VRPTENPIKGLKIRLLQVVALHAPGATSLRPALHRLRGVTIGEGVSIGQDALLETAKPRRIVIKDRASIGIRVTIIAHMHAYVEGDTTQDDDRPSVVIEEEAYVGPGSMILPNVTIGRGSVVMAGSVVTRSVAPMTVVRGNPAEPIARCGIPMLLDTPMKEFYRHLRPL
jgi:acetyltransferase-like isoleucine patch superfamily enzyme